MVAVGIKDRRVAAAPVRNADNTDRPAGASPTDDAGSARGAILKPTTLTPVIPAKAGMNSGCRHGVFRKASQN